MQSRNPKLDGSGPIYFQMPKSYSQSPKIHSSVITVPLKTTTYAQIRRPKTKHRLLEAQNWLLEAQN